MEKYLEQLIDILRSNGIIMSDYVKEQLHDFHETLFPVLKYLIEAQARIIGLPQKLEEFFSVSSNRSEFESQLNELICIYFVEKQLGQTVKEVEFRGRTIVAPTCTNGKSCDLLAEDAGEKVYYESKKNLGQDLRPREKMEGGFEGFTPLSEDDVMQWLRTKLFEANKKGANYLLVRFPFWTPMEITDENEKYKHWMGKIFPGATQISRNHFKVRIDRLRLGATKGLYAVFPDDHIRIDVEAVPA